VSCVAIRNDGIRGTHTTSLSPHPPVCAR
jgi:hypothetical protein